MRRRSWGSNLYHRMKTSFRLPLTASLCLLCWGTGCTKSNGFKKSPDGKTYLQISGCSSAVKVDGSLWVVPKDKPALINPGDHRVSCGTTDTEMDIETGQLAKL